MLTLFALRRLPIHQTFAISCLVGGSLLAVPCSASKLNVGKLRVVRRLVEKQKAKKRWLEVGNKTPVVYGDHIRTNKTGSTQVVFNDGSLLTIGPSTHVRIDEPEADSPNIIVNVFGALGEVFLKARGPIEIRTPAATAAVRSTSLSMRLDGANQSILTVSEGEVEFKNGFGRVYVQAGEQSRAKVGSAPTAPEQVDVSGILSWTGEVAGLPLPFELPPVGRTRTPGNTAPQGGTDAALDAAEQQLQQGNARGAQTAFEALLYSPRGDEARAGLALAFLSNEQRDKARETVSEATTPLASGVRALLLLEDGDAQSAREILEPLTQAPNAPFQLVSLLALAQIQNGNLTGAQATAERAVTLARQSAGAAATLSLAQFFRGNNKGAREQAKRAVELDPFSPLALLALGRVEAAVGDLEEARQALEQVVVFEPKLPGAQRDLGTVETALDRLPSAERAFRSALEQKPDDARSLAGLGTVLLLRGEIIQAREKLEEAVALAPGDPFVRAQQIGFLVSQKVKDLDSALQEGRAFLASQLGSPSANPATGATLGSDEPSLGAVLINLSEAALFRQKLNEALYYAQRAVKVLPNSSPAQYQLGRVFLEQGRTTQAQSRFQLAAILDQNSPRARYGLGFVQGLIAQGDDVARPLGQVAAAVEAAPNVALSLQNQSFPGASERLQAALQDPTSVRAASRSFGDWQLSGQLGNYSQATGEISYLHESGDGRGLTAFGLRRDTRQGVRPGNASNQSEAAVSFGRKAKDSPSSFFTYIGYESVSPVTDGEFDQPPQIFTARRERPSVLLGGNIASSRNHQTRMFVQLDRNSGDSLFSNGPLNSQYESIHGEIRHDWRLNGQLSLNIGGSWGQRRSDVASLSDFSSAGTPLKFFNNLNFDAHNLVGYARAAFTPSRNLKLEGEMKVRSLSTHLISGYYQEPVDPAFPPSLQESNQNHTQVLPSFIATYRSGRSTLLRIRARRLLGAIEDFELLSPTDLFGFNSNNDVPFLDFGSRGKSYEFEVNHTFSNSSFLRVGLFRVEQGVGTRLDTFEKFNSSRVQGARVGYEGVLNRTTSFFAAAGWNGSRAQTQNPAGGTFASSTISAIPNYSAEIGFQYRKDNGLFIQPSLGYIGSRYRARLDGQDARQELGGFPLLSLRIGKQFGLNRSFYIEGSNLLDRTYTLATGGYQRSQPGRQIKLGALLRF